MEFIDLKSQYQRLQARIDARIKTVLAHGQFILGPEVRELEQQLAEYCGVRHAIGVANGTDALQLALMALEVGPGDAVLTTAFSFFATAEVIPLVGARPIFVDVQEDSFNLDPAALEQAITVHDATRQGKLKAVIAVDLFGLPADYPRLEAICKKHNLHLIEDAAQSFGGAIGTRKAGSFGDISTTSFFPAKPLGCYGDGGAVFTNSDELATALKSLRVHGKGTDKYDNVRIGLNSRLDTLQAAILLEKLPVLDEERERKQEFLERYNESLQGAFALPRIPDGYVSAIAQYTLRVESGQRSALQNRLRNVGVPTQIYYHRALHRQPALQAYAHKAHCPVSDRLSEQVLSLPIHAYMTNHEQDNVIEALLGRFP
ncbi:DegT/DnrJ/EryC1/StrS aminotransferase family protein [Haliea sp. E1-2-M8]|uniref:DegT/DnrJ/EryC1/StrS family aminotransferase n=1 Tax=Haliea sp. E1-2-M8 TaxID=3064706 RepID=UPI0027224812|nr:DegT/DnrJ/EryC1/StrS aminotransferase family protein [Haliea sp. E1-2-M8]MDO8861106.1 DegT/DnrJ/EryC1/StrS aminotransferase family protein [Haliea sp. E1-2-M8]